MSSTAPTVTETCACGATITVTAVSSMARKVELEDFRRAHFNCRFAKATKELTR